MWAKICDIFSPNAEERNLDEMNERESNMEKLTLDNLCKEIDKKSPKQPWEEYLKSDKRKYLHQGFKTGFWWGMMLGVTLGVLTAMIISCLD